jgi:parallel beta-helix repeat protein
MNVRARGARGWAALAAALLLSAGSTEGAGSYHVDRTNPSCSNTGPGSAAVPYCTITAAVNARGGPGTTILVRPGRYREQVTVPASGMPGSSFVLQATGPGVVVDGSDDLSSPALWQPYSGSVFLATSASWAPRQVFVDGSRLTASIGTLPAGIPAGSFLAIAGEGLYVNLGGDHPGNHVVDVGRRFHGFLLNGQSWVTIDGFEIVRAENRGIGLNLGSNDCVISSNTVSSSRFQGIVLSGSTRVQVLHNKVGDNADHGIYLINSHANTVRGNESYGNARPAVRAANGLSLSGSTGNLIENNRLHHNQDSGMQFGAGSHRNLSRQNISWSNGDHGFDHLDSAATQHIGDVAWGNYKDGFSQEGNAPGTLLSNCIGVDNGLTTAQFNLWVDGTSSAGFRSDHNIFWNSNGQVPIRFVATSYATTAAFAAATGHDVHSVQADPRFTDPLAGLFSLLAGSPAIDSANSAAPNWPSLDATGAPRKDSLQTADTGTGPVSFADRGAIEFEPGSGLGLGQLTPTASANRIRK